MQDERNLVQRAQRQDGEAFTHLYESYFDKVYRYIVIRIGNRTEAEDLTQQVFLKVVRAISSFKWKGTPFSAWLFRIAHNQVVDHRRKEKRRLSSPLNESIVSNDNPEQIAETNLDIEQMLKATKRLTKAQQEVISLRFSADLSTSEVARIMGKSDGAIKALQHSAIVALRKALQEG